MPPPAISAANQKIITIEGLEQDGKLHPLQKAFLKEEPSAGTSETPVISIAPAIENAIFAATEKRLRSLPVIPNGMKF